MPFEESAASDGEFAEMNGMEDEDEGSGAGDGDVTLEGGHARMAVAIFIDGHVAGRLELNVGDIADGGMSAVFEFAVMTATLEINEFGGGDAIDVVDELLDVGGDVGKDVVEGAGLDEIGCARGLGGGEGEGWIGLGRGGALRCCSGRRGGNIGGRRGRGVFSQRRRRVGGWR